MNRWIREWMIDLLAVVGLAGVAFAENETPAGETATRTNRPNIVLIRV